MNSNYSFKNFLKNILKNMANYAIIIPVLIYGLGFIFTSGLLGAFEQGVLPFDHLSLGGYGFITFSNYLYFFNGIVCIINFLVSVFFLSFFLFVILALENRLNLYKRYRKFIEFLNVGLNKSVNEKFKKKFRFSPNNALLYLYIFTLLIFIVLIILLFKFNIYNYFFRLIITIVINLNIFIMILEIYKEKKPNTITLLKNHSANKSIFTGIINKFTVFVYSSMFSILLTFIFGLLSMENRLANFESEKGSFVYANVTMSDNTTQRLMYLDSTKENLIGYQVNPNKLVLIPWSNIINSDLIKISKPKTYLLYKFSNHNQNVLDFHTKALLNKLNNYKKNTTSNFHLNISKLNGSKNSYLYLSSTESHFIGINQTSHLLTVIPWSDVQNIDSFNKSNSLIFDLRLTFFKDNYSVYNLESTINKFYYTRFISKNFTELKNLYSKSYSSIDDENFKKVLEKTEKYNNRKVSEYISFSASIPQNIDETNTTYDIHVIEYWENDIREYVTFSIIKENAEWKINKINFSSQPFTLKN